MAHALGVRATSFAASAALLGLAVLGALSVSVTLTQISFPTPSPIDVVPYVPDEPPPPPPVVRELPPQPPTEDLVVTELPATPLAPTPVSSVFGPVATQVGPAEITNPHWLQRPRDLGAYYPRRAEARGVTGEVVLNCLVSTSGRLDCAVVSETPTNWGFAEAALRISRDHRMAPAMQEGTPVQGRYRMRVPFEVR